MTEQLPSCCQFHGYEEGGCNGRGCPEGRADLSRILTRRVSAEDLTRRQQEAEARWAQGIGVEAADAPRVTGAVPPIVTTELRPVREPWTFGEVALVLAAVWLCGSLVYLRFWG